MTKLGPCDLNNIVTGDARELSRAILDCEDCGLPYQEFGIDTTLPNAQWLAIHPEGPEGILCANCIVKRALYLPGVIAARMVLAYD